MELWNFKATLFVDIRCKPTPSLMLLLVLGKSYVNQK